MNYQLPPYPTNRLEALLYMDHYTSNDSNPLPIVAGFIPLDEISQIGMITMSIIKLLTSQCDCSNITLIYDPTTFVDDEMIWLVPWDDWTSHVLITNFGHHITVTSTHTFLPHYIEEVCCMIQLYQTIKHLSIYTIDQISDINQTKNPIIWIGSNLHHQLDIDTTLAQDNEVLTSLQIGQVTDTTIVWHHLIATMISYYESLDNTYSITALHYHNTSIQDGQLDHTSGYCAGIISILLA